MISSLRKNLNLGKSLKDCSSVIFKHGSPLLIGFLLVLPQTILTCYFYDRYVSWFFFRANFFKISLMGGLTLIVALLTLSLNYVIAMSAAITAVKNHKNPRKLDDKAQQKEMLSAFKILLPKGIQMVFVCWGVFFVRQSILRFLTRQLPAHAYWIRPIVGCFVMLVLVCFLSDHMRGYHWVIYRYHGATPEEKEGVWESSQPMLTEKRMWLTCSRFFYALPFLLIWMMFWGISYALGMPFDFLFNDWKTRTVAMLSVQCCFLIFIMMRLLFHINMARKGADVVQEADLSDAFDFVEGEAENIPDSPQQGDAKPKHSASPEVVTKSAPKPKQPAKPEVAKKPASEAKQPPVTESPQKD